MSDPNCIFCKIIARQLPALILQEDDYGLVFLDIAPFEKGHALVIPKYHAAQMTDLPLVWLQRLPVDQIKIDRSFVTALPDDTTSLAVVRGVLALARELDLDVVAEGVEQPEQLRALREAGCRLVQGYLLGRPSSDRPLAGAQEPLAPVGEGAG